MKKRIEVPPGDVLDWPVKFIAELTARPEEEVEEALRSARRLRERGRNVMKAPDDREGLLSWAAFNEAGMHPDSNFPAREVDWRADDDYALAPFVDLMAGGYDDWVEWFHEECVMQVEEGRDGYLDLLLEEIEEPVTVVELSGDRVDVWDGWHRIGASIVRRAEVVPVLVGDRRNVLTHQGPIAPKP
jgi:hypothetical protein